MFTKEDMDNMPDLSQRHPGEPIRSLEITVEMVEKRLRKLRPTKSPGPDGFHPRVLQETASTINLPLSLIFMKSLAENRLLENRQHHSDPQEGKEDTPR